MAQAKSKAKRIWITNLRRKYPHPVRAIAGGFGDYCVGGALCLEVGIDKYFPNEREMVNALLKANPNINWDTIPDRSRDELYNMIHGVIEANDGGNFELSWRLLGRLLHWRPE